MNPSASWWRRANTAVCGVCAVACVYLFGWEKPQPGVLQVVLPVVGLVALVPWVLGRLEEFSAAGVGLKVKLRRLDEATGQAEAITADASATLEQVRALAATMAKTQLDTLGPAGLFGSPLTWSDKWKLREATIGQLQKLAVDESEQRSVVELFDRLCGYSLALKVCAEAAGAAADESRVGFQALLDDQFDFPDKRPSVDVLEGLLKTHGLFDRDTGMVASAELRVALDDLRYFDKLGKVRDRR